MSSTGPSTRAVCRILNQNSCGSGAICGVNPGGSYVITNAHVAGTDKNRPITVESEKLQKRFTGRIVEAMYNKNAIGADWALMWVPNLVGIEPVYLTKNLPAKNESLYTKGFPKCVAHAGTDISQFKTLDNGILLWLPNSIGGQSGSGVWGDLDGLQKALLTWSIRQGNRWYGGGQLTNAIYDQMKGRVSASYLLPKDWEVIELPGPDGDYDRTGLTDPTVEECYWTERAVNEMWPIWAEDQKPVEPGPVDPPNLDWRLKHIESLRRYRDQFEAELKAAEEVRSGVISPDQLSKETFGL